jgi:NADH-quinone oxidoreductase subunit F
VAEVERILIPDEAPVASFEDYRARGGGQALEKALSADPNEIIDEVRRANLRGRGGAGFPTAIKWQGLCDTDASTKFVCCNSAEGEPGTFKDRYLLRKNPYQALEGLAIACHVIGAQQAYFCMKQRFQTEYERVSRALDELSANTEIGHSVLIEIVLGPDEYLYGEEKAMLSVVEGGLPLPRILPPYMHGLFAGALGGPEGNPTVVNNVETLSNVPHILNKGADWFRSFGTDDTPGTMVFTISGDVQRPRVVEVPLGVTLRQLIYDFASGPPAGRNVKAVFPGIANAVATEAHLDTPLGFDSMRRAGSALGSAGFIVYDDHACMVQAAYNFSHFLHIESCNQCAPCKLGAREITERLERAVHGWGSQREYDEIAQTTTWVNNGQRCYLPTSESVVVSSILEAFPEDFARHLEPWCRLRHDLIIPKMTDYVEGEGFTYDEDYMRKQPDWTYAPA